MTSEKGEESNPGSLMSSMTPENFVKRPVCSTKSSGA
ncbi:APOBEC1 isoform 2 [Pongo abelii]|uniref:APOBEC1 isoform 2 n=1 Tax=Pongo abelii TaxID=9601 RepID=A0A2J8TBU7_PONAB|nr:APOBEC1 isoform 2 [Pongo abelii]